MEETSTIEEREMEEETEKTGMKAGKEKTITAEELAKEFKEHSVAEFFRKNKQMLGLYGKVRTLTTIVHEYVTNNLDACEEANILPDIDVKIDELGSEYYEVTVQDNGPGLTEKTVGKALGQLLAGTKFHRLIQSLTDDELIIYKEKNRIIIKSIGEFVDGFLAEGETEKDISNLGIEVPAFNWNNYKYAFRNIKHVIRHPRENEIYEIKTRYGKSVKVTGCHSLFALNTEGIVNEVEARNINKGDFLVVPKKMPEPQHINEINILDFLNEEEIKKNYWYCYGISNNLIDEIFSKTEIVRKKSKSGRIRKYFKLEDCKGKSFLVLDDSVKQNYLKKGFLPVEMILRLGLNEKVKNCAIRTYQHGKISEMPISWKITPEFMRFLGFFISEGHSDRRQIGFTFGKHEKDFVNELKEFAESIGVNTTKEIRERSLRLKLFGGVLSILMRKWCGHLGKNKKIPEFVFSAEKEMRQHFLDALYQGDGHNTKNRNQLMHSTISKTLADQLQYLWLFQGITAGRIQKSFRGFGKKASTAYTTTVYGSNINKSHIFSTNSNSRIQRSELVPMQLFDEFKHKNRKTVNPELAKIFEGLGLGSQKKQINKYIEMFDTLFSNKNTEINLSAVEGVNQHNIKHLINYGFIEENSNGTLLLTSKALKLKNLLTNLERFKASDLTLLEVTDIKKIDKGYKFVYDVSVSEHENFIGGTGGISCHNSRGQQGIGAAGCTMLSQTTTGKPIKVITGTGNGKCISLELTIDPEKNHPVISNLKHFEKDFRGVAVQAKFKGVLYREGESSPLEYLRRSAIANPHAQITFRDPKGRKTVFNRSVRHVPKRPVASKPHPKGVTVDELITMSQLTAGRKVNSFLKSDFDRTGATTIKKIQELVPFDLNKDPKQLSWDEAEAIVKAFRKVDIASPTTEGLSPIGEERIKKSLENIVEPEIVYTLTRKPRVYAGGYAFEIEVGIAYGGGAGRIIGNGENVEKRAEVMRFANRAPLLFDGGNCAITKAVNSVEWKRYAISDVNNAPLSIFVNLISVHVPYTGAGKQAIADEEEVMEELRLSLMQVGRKTARYILRKERERIKQQKKETFMKYAIEVCQAVGELAKKDPEKLKKKLLNSVVKKLKIEEEQEEKEEEELESDEKIEEELDKLEEKKAKKKDKEEKKKEEKAGKRTQERKEATEKESRKKEKGEKKTGKKKVKKRGGK